MSGLLAAEAGAGAGGLGGLVIMYGALFALLYFFWIRPQNKDRKKMSAMLSTLEIGDNVLTSSGFFGVVIDIDEERGGVIVEFGNNKNCRIPMKKEAIVEVEKPGAAEVAESKQDSKKNDT